MSTELVSLPGGLRGRRHDFGAGLPPSLADLLAQLTHERHRDLRFLGPREACATGGGGEGVHDLAPWVTGVFRQLELVLRACLYCGAVEVRDVTVDLLPGVRPGASKPARRDAVVGWYSGRRPAGRAYM